MNNHESDRGNKKKQETQIFIELDDSEIQLPLSTFNEILECEITNYISKIETPEKDVIDPYDMVFSQDWKKNYEDLEQQTNVYSSIVERYKRNLKRNPLSQPSRFMVKSVGQNINVTTYDKINEAEDALKNSNEKQQVFTISDSEDDVVIITDTPKIKSTLTKTENIIDDLIDLDNNTKNLEVNNKSVPKSKTNYESDSKDDVVIITDTSKIKSTQTKTESIHLIDLVNNTQNLKINYKPAPKSKKNISIPDLKTNDSDKVLPINTEARKTLSNLELTRRKRKPGPKSKTMFNGDMMVPFNAEKRETVEKKTRLNECEVMNNKESNTKTLLNCNSVKRIEVPKKDDNNFLYKSSNLNYPPPYPSIPPHNTQPSWKNVPSIPNMTIKTSGNIVTITWDVKLTFLAAEIKMYELFVCQETDAPPDISMWIKKGDIPADLLPMACELKVFDVGHIYYFALRAVDVHNRRAPFAVEKKKI